MNVLKKALFGVLLVFSGSVLSIDRSQVVDQLTRAQRVLFLLLVDVEAQPFTLRDKDIDALIISKPLAIAFRDLFNKASHRISEVSNFCVDEQEIIDKLEQLNNDWIDFENVVQKEKAKDVIAVIGQEIKDIIFRIQTDGLKTSSSCQEVELERELEKIMKESSGDSDDGDSEKEVLTTEEELEHQKEVLEFIETAEQETWSYWDYVPFIGTKKTE